MGSRFRLWGASPGLDIVLPSSRILAGGLVLAGLLLVAPSTLASVAWIAASALLWVGILRSPIGLVLGIAVWSVIVGSPLFVLGALAGSAGGGNLAAEASSAFYRSIGILIKGCAVTTVALTTLSTLDPAQLQGGLQRLRVPEILSGLVTQILVQAGNLLEESGNLRRALQLRVPSSRSRTAWLIVRGLVTLWLPRLLERSERVAGAMALRGFDGGSMLADPASTRLVDWLMVIGGLIWLGASVAIGVTKW